MGESASSSDYLQVKKRKLIGLNKPSRSSSTHTENRQFGTLYSHGEKERFLVELPKKIVSS